MSFYTPGTTNLCTYGGFETDTTGWELVNLGALARDTSDFKFGAASLRVGTTASALDGAWTIPSIGVTASLVYTASAWANAPAGAAMILRLRELTTADASVGDTQTAFTGTGSWLRLTVTRTFGATGVKARVFVMQSDAVARSFYIDGAQLEQKSFATPYVETNGATASRSGGKFGSGHFYAPLTGR